jgi:hypothetical protein
MDDTAFDEVFAELISVACERVYHLEVAQDNPSTLQYPCLVYKLDSSIPEDELDGNACYYRSVYTVLGFAEDSVSIRDMAKTLKAYNTYEQLVSIETTYPLIQDFKCEDDAEDNEFAFEQQDRGYKVVALTMSVFHKRSL